MQIAFHAQLVALEAKELDAGWVAKEREIFLAQVQDMPEAKRAQIAEGKLGMKTGSGIYDYTPEQIDQLRGQRAAKLVAVRKALEG